MTTKVSPDLKKRALTLALEELEKKYGSRAVMRLGDQSAQAVEVISSGSLSLNDALGCGGYPRGRVVEVFGPESSGKTTLALHAIASVQGDGGTAAFIDVEHALDPSYAKNLRVDVEQLLISQPDSGEQALEIAETLVRSGAIELIVIDSVAALVPQAEIDGNMGDAHMGLQARLMSQALRKNTAVASRTNCTVLFINQIRQKIGVTFGNNEVTSGGNALKFYASQRVDIRRIGAIKDGDTTKGNKTRIRVVKNKMASPHRSVEVELIYGRGICQAAELIQSAEELGHLKKSGSWYSMGTKKLGQGKETIREKILEDAQLFTELTKLVRGKQPAAAAAK